MTSHDEFDASVAAYALGALDEGDRIAFEAHLASCERCQGAIIEFGRVNVALGMAVEPVAPPASLKARTIARATAGSRPSPVTVPTLPPRAVRPVSFQWLAAAAGLVLVAGLAVYAMSLRSEVLRLREMASDAQSRAETLRAELTALRQDSARLMNAVSVLSAPDVVTVNLRGVAGAPGATGRAYVSSGRGLVFAANQLPALAPGRIYQLWVIPPDSSVPLSAGVFSVDASGTSPAFSVPLPPGADRVRTVAVTEEPGPAGSPKASTPILLVGSAAD